MDRVLAVYLVPSALRADLEDLGLLELLGQQDLKDLQECRALQDRQEVRGHPVQPVLQDQEACQVLQALMEHRGPAEIPEQPDLPA